MPVDFKAVFQNISEGQLVGAPGGIPSPVIDGYTIKQTITTVPETADITLGAAPQYAVLATMPAYDVQVTVSYEPNPTFFKVNYLLQQIADDGTLSYSLDQTKTFGSETPIAVGTPITYGQVVATADTTDIDTYTPPFSHFLSPGIPSTDTAVLGTVTANGQTEINVYYNLKTEFVNFDSGSGSYVAPLSGLYGEERVPPSPTGQAGLYFAGWFYTPDDATAAASVLTADPGASVTSVNPVKFGYNQNGAKTNSDPVTLYAAWVGTEMTSYRVNYYLENLNVAGTDINQYTYAGTSDSYQIALNQAASLTWNNINVGAQQAFEGFLHRTAAPVLDTTTQNADGTWTLNVYYTRQSYSINMYSWVWSGMGSNAYGAATTVTREYGADITDVWATAPSSTHTWSLQRNTGTTATTQTTQYALPTTMPYPGAVVGNTAAPGAADGATNTTLYLWDFVMSLGDNNALRIHTNIRFYEEALDGTYTTMTENRVYTVMGTKFGDGTPHTGSTTPVNDLVTVLGPIRSEVRAGFVLNDSPDAPASDTAFSSFEGGTRLPGWSVYNNTGPVDWGADNNPAFVANLYYHRATTTVNYWTDDTSDTSPYASVSGKYGSNIPSPTINPTKAGYRFVGWFTNPVSDGIEFNQTTFPAQAITNVYAHWELADEYTVTFAFLDGRTFDPTHIKLYKGETLNDVPDEDQFWLNPIYNYDLTSDRVFVGWYRDGATATFDFDTEIWTDVTLYARWSGPVGYRVDYVEENALGTYVGKYAVSKIVPAGSSQIIGTQIIENALPGTTELMPTKLQDRINLTPDENLNVITFHYRPQTSATYTINYLDIDDPSGTPIATQTSGSTYNAMQLISAKDVANHTLVAGPLSDDKAELASPTWVAINKADSTKNVFNYYYKAIKEIDITDFELSVDITDLLTKVYGEDDPATLDELETAINAELATFLTDEYSTAVAADFSVTLSARVTGEDVGTYNYGVTIDYDDTAYGLIGDIEVALEITKREVTITTSANPATVAYGTATTAITYTAVVGSLASNLTIGVVDTVTGVFNVTPGATSAYTTTTAAGVLSVTATNTGFTTLGTTNYTLIQAPGQLTVGIKEIDITDFELSVDITDLLTKVYGEDDPATLDELETAINAELATFLTDEYSTAVAADFSVTLSARVTGEDVGTYNYGVTIDYDEENYTLEGSISVALTITPRPATMTADYAFKAYAENDPATFTATPKGFLASDAPTASQYTVTRPGAGTDEDVDYYDGALEFDTESITYLNENYEVEWIVGDFEITANPALDINVTVTANSASYVYNNTQWEVNGYVINGLPENDLFLYEIRTSGATATNVSVTSNILEFVEIYYNGVNVTDKINLTRNNGALTITPRPVILTVSGATKVVGAADDFSGVTATFNDALAAGALFISSIGRVNGFTAETVGTYTNAITAYFFGNANFAVTVVNGTLTITAAAVVPPVVPPVLIPVVPAAPPAAAPVVIPNPAVPLAPAAPVTTIADPETPLAAPSTAAWALINLILAIISLVFAIALAVGFASRRKGEEANKQKGTQDSRGGRGVVWRTIAVIFGVASPIVFILTEDVTLPMIWVDAWTLLMVVLLAVQIVSAVALKYARREDDSNNQQAQTA